jgi:diguanylate cyclase (GGDEF)-like protein
MADARQPLALVVTTGFDEYQQQLVRGVLPVLTPRGRTLVITSFSHVTSIAGPGLPESFAEILRETRPYGVITTGCVTEREEAQLVALVSELGIPTVWIGVDKPGWTTVRGDDVAGMRALMRHVLDERGVRRPAFVRGIRHHSDSVRRERTFREELTARGIPVDEDLVIDGFFWHETAYRELRALLERRRDMDAVIAANDVSALGVVQALNHAGLRVPDDVLVTGFDNDTYALCWPELTTVDPDLQEQGRRAATTLLAEVDGAPSGQEVVVPGRIVIRGSTGIHPAREPDRVSAAVGFAQAAQQQLATRDALWGLSFDLSHCTSVPEVASALADSHLVRLGVSRCFLALFVDPPVDEGDRAENGMWARLILDYREERAWPVSTEEYPLGQFLPAALRPELRTGGLVFQSLRGSDRELGYFLLEQAQGSGLIIDGLRMDLSRTLEALFATRALVDHAENLEQTVEMRTAELAARSRQLELEVETRRQAECRLQEAVADLRRLAMSDALTGLANRTALQQYFDQHWPALIESGGQMAVLMVDVDLFKAYNDRYGHLRGDETLRAVADCLCQALGDGDTLASRYGGEEFVLVLPDGDLDAANRVAERVRSLLAEEAVPHETSTVAPVVTVSIGVAVARATAQTDPWRLLDHADRALYRAKVHGRDRVCSVTPRTATTPDRPLPRQRHPRQRHPREVSRAAPPAQVDPATGR